MILRNATMLLMDDTEADRRGVLVISPDGCLYFDHRLSTSGQAPPAGDNCRTPTLAEVREFFAGPGRAVNPEFTQVVVAELDRLIAGKTP
jgi:hypothetical protein